jgi:nitrate reductase gamma subunit
VISTIYAVLFYVATILMVVGTGMKVLKYARTPAPLKIPVSPAPRTRSGVVMRMVREVFLFQSLFKSNRWIWVFSILFHYGMLLVLLRHLRYFTQPVWWWVDLIQPIGVYASFAMLAGLVGLMVRRITVQRIRYISDPSDYLMLALLIAIAASGAGMKFLFPVDILGVKTFMFGLMRFQINDLPTQPGVLIHLGLVAILMIIFPISKLMHAPGLFFAPSRTQVDNAREFRHLSAWASQLPPLPEGIPETGET